MGMVFGFKLHALTNIEGLFERRTLRVYGPDEAVLVRP